MKKNSMGERTMIKKLNHSGVFFITKKREKKCGNKSIITLFLVSLLAITSIVFSGCVSTGGSADVWLTNMTHLETVDFPIGYKSTVTFSLENIGDIQAKAITMRVVVHDNDGNEQYNNEESVSSVLDPQAIIPYTIFIIYDADDVSLDLNITVRWDTGEHTYTKSFVPQITEYANVELEYLTHHERIVLPDVHISHVNFTLRNTGNITAEDVKANIAVYDQDSNEQYHQEVNVSERLIPEAFTFYDIDIAYDTDDILLNLNITIQWSTGKNTYSRSFSPEIIEQANVQLENMTHFERYQLFVGHISMVDFILQNRGNTIAEDITIKVIAQDQNGNTQYTGENTVIAVLLPGAIAVHEISIPYDLDDERLDLTITVKWTGGENQYTQSFTPKLLL
jgi:hypothetical protein